jgi:hypothetical protein
MQSKTVLVFFLLWFPPAGEGARAEKFSTRNERFLPKSLFGSKFNPIFATSNHLSGPRRCRRKSGYFCTRKKTRGSRKPKIRTDRTGWSKG